MNTVLILVIGCIHLVQCNEVPIQRLSVRPPCEQGSPIVNAQCGVNGTKCPDGYYCDINLCCQIPCKNGSPHPTKTCGQTAGFNNCPTGYSCHAHPAGAYFACCRSDGIKEGSCPVVKPGTPGICVELCSGDDGCPEKEKCCSTGCGHVCTKPIPGGEVCPIPDCTPPRPLSCTEPDARVFNGVTCPWCPRIVQCKPHCEEGVPLPNINCGLREDSHECPRGYFCNVDPIDRFAVCCREHECPLLKCLNRCEFGFLMDKFGCQTCFCKPRPGCPPVCSIFCSFGNVLDINGCPICKCKTGCRNEILPHPNASCDSVSKSCPFTYVCNIPTSGDDHGVCCPSPCEKGTPLKHVRCGLGGQTCPYGYYCNEDGCCQIQNGRHLLY